MVEVDAVEDLVEFAKIERSGGTVPQLTKTGISYLRYLNLTNPRTLLDLADIITRV